MLFNEKGEFLEETTAIINEEEVTRLVNLASSELELLALENVLSIELQNVFNTAYIKRKF